MRGQPQTFDEWSHLLTLNGFYHSISHFSLPVSWVDTVSNYGSPLGQISHQTTGYLSALLFAVTQDTFLSYNLTLLLGSVIGTFLMYFFLRLHFPQLSSVAGAVLYTFAPYRIANLYVRGALPEFFSSAFIPLVAIGMHMAFIQKRISGLWIIFIGSALLSVSHPMMIVLGFCLLAIYFLYIMFSLPKNKQRIRCLLLCGFFAGLGSMVSAYYVMPLSLEIKYFHLGQIGVSQDSYWFLTPDAFFREAWNYSTPDGVGIRENRLQLGAIELFAIVAGGLLLFYKKYKQQKTPSIMWWWLLAVAIFVFLMSPASTLLYKHIGVLAGIQFPWRFLITMVFMAPFFVAYLLDQLPYKKIIFIVLIVAIALLRFPQLYGKNYVAFPQSRYDFATVNPHSTNMNTIWSEKSSEYPVKKEKVEIIEGQGSISNFEYSPTFRKFTLLAETDVRLADYTYYFPGWELEVNNTPTEIVYQDPQYRGVITYRLPAGEHQVEMRYTDTKIRLVGKLLSLTSLVVATSLLLYFVTRTPKVKESFRKKVLD
ncbi:MAG: hypothetical protein QG639_999 [Patescibacteria group bacterium]|nr:hypothetical protein [Patescibacteria group bacterium]